MLELQANSMRERSRQKMEKAVANLTTVKKEGSKGLSKKVIQKHKEIDERVGRAKEEAIINSEVKRALNSEKFKSWQHKAEVLKKERDGTNMEKMRKLEHIEENRRRLQEMKQRQVEVARLSHHLKQVHMHRLANTHCPSPVSSKQSQTKELTSQMTMTT